MYIHPICICVDNQRKGLGMAGVMAMAAAAQRRRILATLPHELTTTAQQQRIQNIHSERESPSPPTSTDQVRTTQRGHSLKKHNQTLEEKHATQHNRYGRQQRCGLQKLVLLIITVSYTLLSTC